MDTQRGEPKLDIIEPSAPPETPVPPQPRETPMPNAPEIIPSQPDFVPGVRPEEYPASASFYLSERSAAMPTPEASTEAKKGADAFQPCWRGPATPRARTQTGKPAGGQKR